MTDNELLLAISDMMDKKLESNLTPMENHLSRMEVRLTSVENRLTSVEDRLTSVENRLTGIETNLENNIVPRLNTIESCYTDTYSRYQNYGDKMEAVFEDVNLLKKVVAEHSEMIPRIS